MATHPMYEEILQKAQLLPSEELDRLLQDLATMSQQRKKRQRRHSIMELKGLGKEVWEGIDVEKYIDEERNSW